MSEVLKPVFPDVFEEGPPPNLTGGYCEKCDRSSFPKPLVCPYCLGPVAKASISSRGILHSYTVVRTKAPYGLPEPYAVGYVDLKESGLRVFALLDSGKIEKLKINEPVELHIGAIGVDHHGQPCLRYYFSPITQRGGR
jgi:uncharacterized protein